MNILVTGGCGFIGTNFIEYLSRKHKSFHVVIMDALTYAATIPVKKSHAFIYGDIRKLKDVLNATQGIDIVVHFAAETHVDRSIKRPSAFIKTNIFGTQKLLYASIKNKVRKFIHISTDEVYGSLGKTGFFSEKSQIAPNNPYSASKAASDLLAISYYKTFCLPVIITRCSNNYGPFQNKEKLIPTIITKAIKNEAIPIYGDGLNVRDWIYVEDHCEAIDAILHNGKIGEVYNIGGNNEWSNIDIAKLILRKMNKPESLIKLVNDRLGHDRRYAMDISKARTELSWQPKTDFDSGIKKTIEWYVNALYH